MRQQPGPGAWAGRTWLLPVLLLAVLAAACTTGADQVEPTPSPSVSTVVPSSSGPSVVPGRPRVAVVVSPDPPLRATTADVGVRALERSIPGDLELRVVTADDASFLPDITSFLATEGYDLVCAVGVGAAEAVAEVARAAPSARFCAAPAAPGSLPDNALAIDLRTDEAAYVIGRAAALTSPGGSIGLLTDGTAWMPDRLEAGLAQALADAGEGGRVLSAMRLDSDDVADQVTRLVGGGAATLVTSAGVLDRAVLEVARQTPLPIDEPSTDPSASATPTPSPSPEPVLPGLVGGPELRPVDDAAEIDDEVMAVIEIHAEVAIEAAIRRLLDGWSTEPAAVGLAEGAVVIEVPSTARGQQVRDLVDQLVAEISSGEREVPTTAPS